MNVMRPVLIAGFLVVGALRATATPYTEHFDTLIADLHSRADSLTGTTDSVQQKQLKAILSVFKSLEEKDSSSLAADIKNAGKVYKKLAKAFPEEFGSSPGDFAVDLEDALDGLVEEVRALADAALSSLNALPNSTCKSAALINTYAAKNLCDETLIATDFAAAVKLLGTGLKAALKAGASVGKCASSGGGGGGGGGSGDTVTATINGSFSANLSASGMTYTAAIYSQSIGILSFSGADLNINHPATVAVAAFISGPGTYPVTSSSQVVDLKTNIFYGSLTGFGSLSTGTITIVTIDPAQQTVSGTFEFTAPRIYPAGVGSVSVTQGTFHFTHMQVSP